MCIRESPYINQEVINRSAIIKKRIHTERKRFGRKDPRRSLLPGKGKKEGSHAEPLRALRKKE